MTFTESEPDNRPCYICKAPKNIKWAGFDNHWYCDECKAALDVYGLIKKSNEVDSAKNFVKIDTNSL